jgi:hypothetical protein
MLMAAPAGCDPNAPGPGPGASDYTMDIIEGYSLHRLSTDARLIRYDGESAGLAISIDVTRLGWNERFIVCYQNTFRATAVPTSRPMTQPSTQPSSLPVDGWWIIDAKQHQKYGLFTENAYKATLSSWILRPQFKSSLHLLTRETLCSLVEANCTRES